MATTTDNEKRIAKNTIFLYIRILISIGLSLYTSRVVLEMLGVRDFGIYNIVGGMIIVLSFLNLSMSGATQRFLNFEMGRGAEGKLAETFSSSLIIHLALSGIILILGETVGVWIVNDILVIQPERMYAANWTFQLSLIGGIFTVMMVPFTGAVIAHEKMNIYAVFSLVFSVLKLIIVVLLLYIPAIDNLIAYSWLILIVTFVNFLCYFLYALKKFPECTLKLKADRKTVKDILNFSFSDIIGVSTFTFQSQGILFILNQIGGTVLNAAGGLTSTVALNLNQFGSTIIMAFRPQIIKQFAAKEYQYMQRLMINCSKYAILLFAFFAIPAFVEINFLLSLWLKEVPDHTAVFCRITLFASMAQMTVLTLNCGIHASGKIFKFSALTGLTAVIDIPLMYYLAVATDNPNWLYIIPIFQYLFLIGLVAKMLKNRMPQFRILQYVLKGFVSPSVISLVIGVVTYVISTTMADDWVRFIIIGFTSSILLIVSSWIVLFDKEMRLEVLSAVKSKLHIK